MAKRIKEKTLTPLEIAKNEIDYLTHSIEQQKKVNIALEKISNRIESEFAGYRKGVKDVLSHVHSGIRPSLHPKHHPAHHQQAKMTWYSTRKTEDDTE